MKKQPIIKQKRVEKGKTKSFVAFTSLKDEVEQRWYFNSGSSRHMT